MKESEELLKLYEWLIDENREPAQTKFTAGMLRNVAREFEHQLNRSKHIIESGIKEVLNEHCDWSEERINGLNKALLQKIWKNKK